MVVTPTSNANVVASLPKTVLPVLREKGMAPAELEGIDWDAWGVAFRAGEAPAGEIAAAFEAVRAFFRLHTKAELMRWAWESDVHLGPVNTTADLVSNPHFAEKGYWRQVGPYVHPGPSMDMSRTPIDSVRKHHVWGPTRRWLANGSDGTHPLQPSRSQELRRGLMSRRAYDVGGGRRVWARRLMG